MLAYAASLFADLAEQTAVPLGDSADGLAYQLDAAVEALGDEAGSADNGAAARALIEYHALRKFRAAAAARPDFDATAMRGGRSQVYEQIDAMITEAAQRCAAAGYPVDAAVGYGIKGLNLGYLDYELGTLGPELGA